MPVPRAEMCASEDPDADVGGDPDPKSESKDSSDCVAPAAGAKAGAVAGAVAKIVGGATVALVGPGSVVTTSMGMGAAAEAGVVVTPLLVSS